MIGIPGKYFRGMYIGTFVLNIAAAALARLGPPSAATQAPGALTQQ